MKNNIIELLAPAGNIDSFNAAINAGADAIYMGIDKFNARQMAQNFDIYEYIECIKKAHILNVKVYLTLNTLIYDNEIEEVMKLIIKLYSAGLDAVIVQDIAIASLIHKILPNLPLHASTQMSIYNIEQVKYLEKLGFTRVVLAREMTLKEIEYICANTSLDVEVFVHGALCVSYSGQCLLSKTIGSRSANRGNCAQPCRMKYSLYKEGKNLLKDRFLLSKKDIFGLLFVKKLYNIGVKSLKIEGRNKNPEYVAGITKIYRKYLDNVVYNNKDYESKKDEKYVMQIFNRDGKSYGYLDGVKYKESITKNSPKNTGIYLGKVIDQKKEYIKVKLETDISLHDGIEIIKDDNVIFSNIITCIKDINNTIINNTVSKDNIVWLGDVKSKTKIGAKIYKTSDYNINNDLKKYYNGYYRKKRTIDISVTLKKGKNILVNTENLDNNIFTILDYIPNLADKKAITNENVTNAFSKTQDTNFNFNIVNLKMDNDIFIPVSKLNELRRKLVDDIEKSFSINLNVDNNLRLLNNTLNVKIQKPKLDNIHKNILSIYKFNKNIDYIKLYKEKYKKDLEIVYIDICDMYKYKEIIFNMFKNNVEIYVILPNVGGRIIDEYIFKNIENLVIYGVSGIVVGNIGYIDIVTKLKEKYNITLVADYTLNIFNKYSINIYNKLGFDIICPSLELTEDELISLNKFSNIELVLDYQTVMTSRYCILGSFVDDMKDRKKCSMPCQSNDYYILDTHNKKYNIICNNLDCIMKIVTSTNKSKLSNYRVRHVII